MINECSFRNKLILNVKWQPSWNNLSNQKFFNAYVDISGRTKVFTVADDENKNAIYWKFDNF